MNPIWSVNGLDTQTLQFEIVVVVEVHIWRSILIFHSSSYRTGGEQDDLDQLIREEGVFVFRQAIDHLHCSLGITNVVDLLVSSLFCDKINLGWGIILSHLLP